MLKDWREESEDSGPLPTLSTARPIIGMAVSVCVFVISIMTGLLTICGPGCGYNQGNCRVNPVFPVAVFFFFASIASGICCLIWFIVVLTKNSSRE